MHKAKPNRIMADYNIYNIFQRDNEINELLEETPRERQQICSYSSKMIKVIEEN